MTTLPGNGLNIADVLRDKREDILRLAEQYGASNVRVFGSVARGEAGPDSDIDLLVDFKPDYPLRDYIRLTRELKELLGRPVQIVIDENLRDEFRPYVMHDTIPL